MLWLAPHLTRSLFKDPRPRPPSALIPPLANLFADTRVHITFAIRRRTILFRPQQPTFASHRGRAIHPPTERPILGHGQPARTSPSRAAIDSSSCPAPWRSGHSRPARWPRSTPSAAQRPIYAPIPTVDRELQCLTRGGISTYSNTGRGAAPPAPGQNVPAKVLLRSISSPFPPRLLAIGWAAPPLTTRRVTFPRAA